MPKRPPITWVVIADGARARILRHHGPGTGLAPAIDRPLEDKLVHGHSRDLKSDRPGRAFATGGRRAAMEPHHDYHQYEKHLFARSVARLIDEAALADRFDRLVLVAPPRTLGDLRRELSERAAKLVTGELAKDLTGLPDPELPGHLGGVMAV